MVYTNALAKNSLTWKKMPENCLQAAKYANKGSRIRLRGMPRLPSGVLAKIGTHR